MNITKNFSFNEFEASDTARRRGILNVINSFEVRDAIVELCREVLQPLRDEVGPLTINSGYRCKRLNELVGGVPTSQHTKGEAADIASDNPLELARKVVELNLPFDQLIIYPNFCHVSRKRGGPQRGQILYNRRYKGPRL